MDPLKAAAGSKISRCILGTNAMSAMSYTSLCQCIDTPIGDIGALDKTDSPELRKSGQLHDGLIGKVDTAAKVDVTNSVTGCHKLLDCGVGNVATVTEMEVMEVLSELTDRADSIVCKISALGKYEISQSWSNLNNLLNSTVCQV